MRVRRGGAVWLASAGLLVLTGCAVAPDEPAPSSVEDLPAQGPLEEYIGWSPPEGGTAGVIEQMRLEQSRIAACMSRLGFEYFPEVPATGEVSETTGPVRGTREFVERYGYGLWNAVTEEAGDFVFTMAPQPERDSYLASLSPTAREAYETALAGEIISESADGSIMRSGGCSTFGSQGIAADDAYLLTVHDDALAYLRSLPDDAAFAGLDARWSECMAGEAMSFSSPHRARESFVARLMEFDEVDHDGGDPMAAPEAVERAAEEKRVALADFECRESLDYDDQHTLIAHELQAAYVAEHRADLDLLAEAAAG